MNCFGPAIVATGIAPEEFIDKIEREDRLTPMQTITDGVDIFLSARSRITGHIIENCGDKCVFRAVPAYMDESARKNMDEFSDVEVVDEALSLEGLGYTVI